MPRHQTLHKEVKPNVNKLRRHPYVKKVVIGPYNNCRYKFKPGKIIIKQVTSNGFKVFAYDGSGIFTLYVYVDPVSASDDVRSYIEKHFS